VKIPGSVGDKSAIHWFLSIFGLSLISAAVLLLFSNFGPRLPTQAYVDSTLIVSTRPWTLAWSLMIDFSYRVNGVGYKKTHVNVYHHPDRARTEAKLKDWPIGKEFTVYYNESSPEDFSLDPEGESTAVLVMLLLFMGVAVTLPTIFVWRRSM